MSIAFVVNNYPPHVGGVESHVSSLARSLAGRGHRVTVLTLAVGPDAAPGSGWEDGVEVVRLPATPALADVLALPLPGAARKVRAVLRSRGVDLVSTHTRFFPMSFIGVRAARALGLASVHTEHGSDHVRGVSPLIGLASRMVDRTLGRSVLRRAGRVLGISEAAAAFARSLSGTDVGTFHNAIDTERFKPAPGTLPAQREKLVFLGRLVPGKGWDTTLEAGEAVLAKRSGVELHFIGDGPQRSDLDAAVAASPHRERIFVHGFLSPEQIRPLITGAVLLNPTVLAEGFQTTLLEAVAAGAAVASTPVAAATYLQRQGAPVLTVDAADIEAWTVAVLDLLDAPPSMPESMLLHSMDWQGRTDEFLAIAEELTRC